MAENETQVSPVQSQAKSTIKVTPVTISSANTAPKPAAGAMAKRTIKIASPLRKGMIPNLPPISPVAPAGKAESTQKVPIAAVTPVVHTARATGVVSPEVAARASQTGNHTNAAGAVHTARKTGNQTTAANAIKTVSPSAPTLDLKPNQETAAPKPLIVPKHPAAVTPSAPTLTLQTPSPAPSVVTAQPGNPALAVNPNGVETAAPTIKIKPPPAPTPAAAPKPATPAAPTINLQTPKPATPAAPTINLQTPKPATPAAPTINLQTPKPATPAAPTINLQTPKPATPTLNLKTPAAPKLNLKVPTAAPAAPTLNLQKPAAEAPAEPVKSSKTPTLDLKPSDPPKDNPSQAQKVDLSGLGTDSTEIPEEDSAAEEPGLWYLVTSAVSLVILLLIAYILFAQYGGYWMNGVKLPVPGMRMTVAEHVVQSAAAPVPQKAKAKK